MMAISTEEVLHVAQLAKLELDSDKVASFKNEFNNILEFVEHMNEVDTDGVKVTYTSSTNHNVMRKDIPNGAMAREDLMKNVKMSQDGFIKVPAILNNGEGDA